MVIRSTATNTLVLTASRRSEHSFSNDNSFTDVTIAFSDVSDAVFDVTTTFLDG